MKASGPINAAWVLAIILGLTGASCIRPLAPDLQPLTSKGPDATTKVKVQADYGKLPLYFEANQGQSDEQVKFLSRGRGYTLFLTSTEAVLALRKPRKNSPAPVSDPPPSPQPHDNSLVLVSDLPTSPQPHKNSLAPVSGERVRVRGPDPEQTEQTVLRMKLVGANPNPHVVGLDELLGKSNYFIGNDPEKWRTNIPTYAKVKYQAVYPGVDLSTMATSGNWNTTSLSLPVLIPRPSRLPLTVW